MPNLFLRQLPNLNFCPPKFTMKNSLEISIGLPAPTFIALAYYRGSILEVDSNNYKDKLLVLFFYPFDFHPVTSTEIISLNQVRDQFEEQNAVILAISGDSVHSHRHFVEQPLEKGGIPEVDFPLVSDLSGEISDLYGVKMTCAYFKGVPARAVFIIDSHGILRYSGFWDVAIGRNIEEILRAVQAVKYAEEYGEIDPMKLISDK